MIPVKFDTNLIESSKYPKSRKNGLFFAFFMTSSKGMWESLAVMSSIKMKNTLSLLVQPSMRYRMSFVAMLPAENKIER